MSAPYSTVEMFRAQEGANRALSLLDMNDAGVEFAGDTTTGNVAAITDFIEDADVDIEGRLGSMYVVPFASLTSTPKQIQKLSVTGALAQAYERLAPGGEDAKKWRKRFDDACEMYRKGLWIVVGGTRLDADAATASRQYAVESAGTTFAGRIDDDYSDDGVDKSRAM